MKSKKLLAFVTSLSMFASVGTGLVANASYDEAPDGIYMEYVDTEYKDDNEIITVETYYKGLENITGADMYLKFSADVSSVTYTPDSAFNTGASISDMPIAKDSECLISFGVADGVAVEGNHLGTMKITASKTAGDLTITLYKGQISDDDLNSKLISEENGNAADIVAKGWAEPATEAPATEEPATEAPATEAPTATPRVIIRPTQIPTEAPAEEATEIPTAVPVDAGINMTYVGTEEKGDDAVITIETYYAGLNNITGADLYLHFGVDVPNVAYTPDSAFSTGASISDMPIAKGEECLVSFGVADGVAVDGNHLGTLKLTVPKDTADFLVELYKGQISDDDLNSKLISEENGNTTYVVAKGLAVAPATEAPATQAPAFEYDMVIPMSDTIAEGYDKQTQFGKLVGLSVAATIGDSDAEYGKDYVAAYEGKELTKDEYHNLINGYTESDITKVVENTEFRTKYGVTFATAPMYQTDEQAATGEATVLPGYAKSVEATEEKPTEKPATDKAYVTFYDEDGEVIEVIEVTKGGKVKTAQIPNVPAKNGYTGKWVILGTDTTFSSSTTVKEDMSVEPKYTKKTDGGSSSGGGGGRSSSSGGGGTAIAGGMAAGGTGTVTNVVVPVFTDLETVPWAVTAINTLAASGIVNGVNESNTLFEPLFNVTRAQFTKMICVTFDIPQAAPDASRFSDVPWYSWYLGWVEAAAEAGIVQGVSDTEFDPEAFITREQMATMLYRAIISKGGKLDGSTSIAFTDAAQISDYAVAPVNALVRANVVMGRDDGSFGPQDIANRAEAACIIYQYLVANIQF